MIFDDIYDEVCVGLQGGLTANDSTVRAYSRIGVVLARIEARLAALKKDAKECEKCRKEKESVSRKERKTD